MTASAAIQQFAVFDFGLGDDEELRARRLHAESIVVDMLFQGPCGYRTYADLPLPEPTGDPEADLRAVQHIAVRKALAGELEEFYACWAGSGMTAGNRQIKFALDFPWLALAQAQFDRFPWLMKALVAEDIRRAKADGKIAGFLSTQNADGLDGELRRLQDAYDFGVRMIGLTYNTLNVFGGGCTERTDAGVSNLGAALIARMDELGIIVDTSHSGRQTTLDACDISRRPVVASHTSAHSLHGTDRAKSDEELYAIAETGGVIGIYAVPFFLAPGNGVTINAMLDHIDYVAELVGWQHVGIGTDWPMQADRGTMSTTFLAHTRQIGFREHHNISADNLVGFDDYREFPNITRGLVSRAYSDDAIRGILGENFLRVFEAVCG